MSCEGALTFSRLRLEWPEAIPIYPRTPAMPLPTDETKTPNYLFAELFERIAAGPSKFRILVPLSEQGDRVDDATIQWPENRTLLNFGTIALNALPPNDAAEQRHIIFDPIPRVDGIESSGDPLLEPRATVYLLSGRRRRAAGQH
jgi:catalase